MACYSPPRPRIRRDRVGVHMDWRGLIRSDGTGPTPAGPRIDRFTGGLREPLGTEELGLWVRIGVDHATLGEHWLFRGFVDAVVPTYVPDRPDAVRIECIDSLGEAGRVQVDGDRLPHRFAGAPTRIRQILNQAHWPTSSVRSTTTRRSCPAPAPAKRSTCSPTSPNPAVVPCTGIRPPVTLCSKGRTGKGTAPGSRRR